jgi:hypothetical protein
MMRSECNLQRSLTNKTFFFLLVETLSFSLFLREFVVTNTTATTYLHLQMLLN